MAATTRRINLKLTGSRQARAHAEGSRARHTQRAQTHSRHRACSGLRSADLGQPLGPDPETLTKIDQRVRGEGGQGSGIADMETSEKALNPALSIRLNNDAARRSGHLGAASRRDGASAARRRDRELLARTGRSELRSQRAAAASRASARLRPRQPVSVDQQARPRRGLPHGAAASGAPTSSRRTSPQIIKRQDLQRRVALYANAEGRPSGNVGDDVKQDHRRDRSSAGISVRHCRRSRRTRRNRCRRWSRRWDWRSSSSIWCSPPQFASFTQPIAIMALAAVHADRRVAGAVTDRDDAQHPVDDRLRDADGSRHQERHPARRLREPLARAVARRCTTRCSLRGQVRLRPITDDDGGDDFRHAAAGHRASARRGNAGSDGSRDHRWGR